MNTKLGNTNISNTFKTRGDEIKINDLYELNFINIESFAIFSAPKVVLTSAV